VLTHLNTEHPLTASADPLLAETLASGGYVETFRATDLRPGQDQALIYSHRIEHPESGEPIGVLCLSFKFADEMAGIFQRLGTGDDRSVLLLLDEAGRVIASSDIHHIPLGCSLEMVVGDYGIVAFGGREYLAKTCATAGYQGYLGMGWRGHVMVPLSSAFKDIQGKALDIIGKDTLAAILSNAEQFCPALAEIARDADTINLALRRVVWSGQVMAAGASSGSGDLSRLKVILQQISETGDRTSKLFADSIRDLYGTVISSLLADAQFIAGLMIDIMDRNLYERANDCRWWALTPDIRRLMSEADFTPEAVDKINAILAYINGLYTVYTRLFVYDLAGNVVAASDLHQDGLAVVGKGWRPTTWPGSAGSSPPSSTASPPSRKAGCTAAFPPTSTTPPSGTWKIRPRWWGASASSSTPGPNSATCSRPPCPARKGPSPCSWTVTASSSPPPPRPSPWAAVLPWTKATWAWKTALAAPR